MILGTAAYMSPEQARGRPVDKRADVWSFGVLVWEMLTGLTLFAGDTVTDVIAAVVTKKPDTGASDAGADQNILRKGLQGSDPAAPLPGGIGQTPAVRDIPETWVRERNTLVYLTIGASERGLWTVSLDGQGTPEPLVTGFLVDEPRVSPDGRWLAFISNQSGRREVYVEPFRRPA